MRISLAAAALVLLSPIVANIAAGAAAPKRENLSPLVREFAVRREALYHKYAAKRKAMVEQPGWKSLSEQDRKTKLDALAKELDAKDAKLTKDYAARQSAAKDIDQVRARQDKMDWLAQIRIQAAQDARNAKH